MVYSHPPFAPALTALALTSLGACALPGTAQSAPAEARVQQQDVETHPSQGEVRTIESSEATLVTTADGFFTNLDTRELTPGHVYTLWLVVINEPAACETSPCSPPDVLERTDRTRSDVFYGDGIIAASDADRLSAFQPVGDAQNGWFGRGLEKPDAAEIHLVVNDHGPLLPEMAPSMVNTYRGGCSDESIPAAFPDTARADGEPGPNACRLVQDVIFQPATKQGS